MDFKQFYRHLLFWFKYLVAVNCDPNLRVCSIEIGEANYEMDGAKHEIDGANHEIDGGNYVK